MRYAVRFEFALSPQRAECDGSKRLLFDETVTVPHTSHLRPAGRGMSAVPGRTRAPAPHCPSPRSFAYSDPAFALMPNLAEIFLFGEIAGPGNDFVCE